MVRVQHSPGKGGREVISPFSSSSVFAPFLMRPTNEQYRLYSRCLALVAVEIRCEVAISPRRDDKRLLALHCELAN